MQVAPSYAKVRSLDPDVFDGQREEWLREHLLYGDSRAAVVVSISPLVVAAYTDEVDCVQLLTFPGRLVEVYGLEVGSRLLTVNTYPQSRNPALSPGPLDTGRFRDFTPLIAEFLSDEVEAIEARKACISEEEWERTSSLGATCLRVRPETARDGRPSAVLQGEWNYARIVTLGLAITGGALLLAWFGAVSLKEPVVGGALGFGAGALLGLGGWVGVLTLADHHD